MSKNVERCVELTVEIEKLMAERARLESSLTEDERETLISLLDRMDEAKLNKAA